MALRKKHAVQGGDAGRYVKVEKKKGTLLKSFRTQKQIWFLCLLALVWVVIFCYIPMAGNIVAFLDWYPGMSLSQSKFVGLENFKRFFQLPEWKMVIRNTLVISGLSLTIGFVSPIIFALLLNEIRQVKFKKAVQTIVYLPHFLSWVILASVLLEMFGYKGVINSILGVFGIRGKIWFSEESCFRQLVIGSDVWKEFGFNAVIYLAALTGISPELYEAAAIDGCSRWKAVWNITIPGIASTIVVLSILGLGNVLNAGFDQIFNLYSPLVYSTGDILDTWVYRMGLLNVQFSLATAAGLFKSVISFTLIVISYIIAYKAADYKIF